MQTFSSAFVGEMQAGFASTFLSVLTDGRPVSRKEFFDFMDTGAFIDAWHNLALEVRGHFFAEGDEVVLQPAPTPRIFLPGQHGASFHTDHLYGHGLRSITVWVPLHGVREDNSFAFLRKGEEAHFADLSLFAQYDRAFENKLLAASDNVAPGENECVVFSSTDIHGSPCNRGRAPRYSCDFRMAVADDDTSNKNLALYHTLGGGGKWKTPLEDLQGRRFLKYICGCKTFSTRAQHILIGEIADALQLSIVAQEAEWERLGHPIFEKYLDGFVAEKACDSLIIASTEILNREKLPAYANSDVDIFIASEEGFLR